MKTLEEQLKEYKDAVEQVSIGMNAHLQTLKEQIKGLEIASKIKFLPGDNIFYIDPERLDRDDDKSLKDDSFLFYGDNPRIETDGTDNRLELVPEKHLNISYTQVSSIAYGVNLNRSYHSKEKENTWWYKVGYGDKWANEHAVAGTRQELIDRFSEQWIALRDKWFERKRASIEYEKQRKIEEAKRTLEELEGK